MSVNAILNSYQTCAALSPSDAVSNDYWFFYNDDTKVYKRRECNDLEFLLKLLESGSRQEEHRWCHAANLFNTKVKPYMLKTDYEQHRDKSPEKFDFHSLMNEAANSVIEQGDYVVWHNLSAKFFGWVLYLRFNFNVKLSASVPLPGHSSLGHFNLLSTNMVNFDIFSVLRVDDQIWFQNGPYSDAEHAVMDVDVISNGQTKRVQLMCGDQFVGTKNQVLLNYLIGNENVVSCSFTDRFKIMGKIDLRRLRRTDYEASSADIDVDEPPVAEPHTAANEMVFSPCSRYVDSFDEKISECLNLIDKHMNEAMPSNGCGKFLFEYLEASEFCTFPYLIINVWQYCSENINLHNQAVEDDIYMFLKLLCQQVGGNESLYEDNLIYIVSKDNAKKFFASLEFFSEPQKALGYYFALHYDIFKTTESWTINSMLVKQSSLEAQVCSFGFFKKVKHNEVSYIFNGKIYEYVKNKKEHDIAGAFDKADETQVSMFKFNSILNFYMTEDGMFDVCKKSYRETCPFVIMSALKKNFITKNEQIVDKNVFHTLMAAMKNDITLLKTYHAKKFERDFTMVLQNLKDCWLMGASMDRYAASLQDRLSFMVTSVLNSPDSDLVLLMMKLDLTDPISNIIHRNVDVDLMGLQLCVAFQLLWPKSEITSFLWACMLPCYTDFSDVLEDCTSLKELVSERTFNNKKYIFEKLHDHLKLACVSLLQHNNMKEEVTAFILDLGLNDNKKYDNRRVIKKINLVYNKYKKVPSAYNVWTDKLIDFNPTSDDMYSWLTRFYMRMYLAKFNTSVNQNLLANFVQGFCYFRVLTNFNTTSSKAIINFCASLAIPTDYEKMCLVITSEPNCGKSSLFELLDKIILVYKSDRLVYEHNNVDKNSKIKRFESQLYIMNEAETTTKSYLKNIADSTKFESANRKYGPEESFYANYKVMITNNEMLYVKDGYDKACSNRIGQIYIDHSFESDVERFNGSIYECYARKRYHEIKDINSKLMSPVKQFLANVLVYNSDPKTGYVYYKNILQGDKCYKHNKKCLYIYNDRLEALLYVLDVKETKGAQFTEAFLNDMITKCVSIVKHIVHPRKMESVDEKSLFADFRRKYGKGKFFNADTASYEHLSIALNEKAFRRDKPRLKSNIDDE